MRRGRWLIEIPKAAASKGTEWSRLMTLKRSLISGSLLDGARKNMELIKEKLETEYQR